ncbi:MAG: hypothetical protein EP343_20780 [Deltaproteobacteria bacterium]|nr:MAG: hypothetical protein EP343_20780 [Deltaproteobacteria bacterium]
MMEWCNGGRLDPKQYQEEESPPFHLASTHFVPLLDALERIHQQGFVHRNLKPQNILTQEQDGEVAWELSDFGLLKDLQNKAHTNTALSLEHSATSHRSSLKKANMSTTAPISIAWVSCCMNGCLDAFLLQRKCPVLRSQLWSKRHRSPRLSQRMA